MNESGPSNAEEYATSHEDDEASEMLRIKIEVGIYILCFIVGGPLNVLSLVKSLRAFRVHKAKSQILLLRITLNLADLITLFLYVPKQVIWLITYQWYGGEILCRVCAFFSTFSFYLNSFVIACIAIDRVFGAYNISSLNAHRKAYIRCRNLLGFSWIAAFTLSLPQAVVFTTTSPYEDVDFKQCATIFMIFLHKSRIEYSDPRTTDARRIEIDQKASAMEQWEKIYAINHFLFVFWVPCIIIVVSYIIVLLILRGHLRQGLPEKAKTTCFRFRVGFFHNSKSSDIEDLRSRSPTRSTYLLQHDESYAMKSISRENVTLEFQRRSSIRSAQEHSELVPLAHSSSTTHCNTKFGAMAVSTIHKAKQHAKRQAALIIVAYLCIWSPYNVFTVLNLMGVPVMEELRNFLSFLNAAICANTVVNPIIYGVFRNKNR